MIDYFNKVIKRKNLDHFGLLREKKAFSLWFPKFIIFFSSSSKWKRYVAIERPIWNCLSLSTVLVKTSLMTQGNMTLAAKTVIFQDLKDFRELHYEWKSNIVSWTIVAYLAYKIYFVALFFFYKVHLKFNLILSKNFLFNPIEVSFKTKLKILRVGKHMNQFNAFF